ncbi:hypothetical protein JCGZ_04197 [Jatropha curcas]|uniref:Uncharacterized protein n=1 Tax=Jatropha curcas TaxID=180498 RepID=A0A067JA11_JATCU|nr:hypothetical protein JCGZ_04197 [Jatropha curcas]
MTSSSHDADTHASVTDVYAQDSYIRLDVGESSVAEIPIDILDHNNPVGAIISPSHLDFLRHLELCRQNYKSLLDALAERWKEKFNPSILKSLEDLTHLTEYDCADAILSRMYDDMCDLSQGHCSRRISQSDDGASSRYAGGTNFSLDSAGLR